MDYRKHKEQDKIAIVVGRFNQEITEELTKGTIARLQELKFSMDQITQIWVPGAVEIPLTAQRLARTDNYQAIIALGAVIKGETTHYDYVCEQVSQGCQRAALENDIPVVFGVLTTENVAQARDRIGGAHGHKGRDAADTAVEMISVLRDINTQ